MNLKRLRIDKHISLIGVAEDIKINRNTFSKIENGMTDLPARCLNKLSELYGKSVEDIIELHKKDIEEYRKKLLIEQLDEAQNFLSKNDRKSVVKKGNSL